LVELVSALSIGMLVWWASRDVVDASVQAKMAGLIASFILCLQLLFRPLRILADKFNVLQMGMIAANRVFAVLDNTDSMPDEGTRKPAYIRGDIRFEDVTFEYTSGQPVLQGVRFSVAAGQTLAIVGPTGSGKTSIIQLINRLYAPQLGQILIDDIPIEEYELAYLRANIALVLQDVFLFSGTILENITLRDPSISRGEAIAAARQLGAHSFIEQLPGGYDFQVLERGGALSAGLRQLLAFVRAILRKPAVLILDEATASIDQQTERIILLKSTCDIYVTLTICNFPDIVLSLCSSGRSIWITYINVSQYSPLIVLRTNYCICCKIHFSRYCKVPKVGSCGYSRFLTLEVVYDVVDSDSQVTIEYLVY